MQIMTLPTAYLTSFNKAPDILKAIQTAQAPPRFTQRFLESIGFPSTNDRTMINVLKALKFLDETGVPLRRYHEFLDQTQSALILAEAIREAYADLFLVNTKAFEMTSTEVKNKMKTLSEGQFTDRVLTQMAGTFVVLCKEADFSAVTPTAKASTSEETESEEPSQMPDVNDDSTSTSGSRQPRGQLIDGLVYNINLHLPDTRDQAVFDALFRSLRQHLMR